MDNERTLYLIDGHALIFKMYYALLRHPMVNSKGTDTSILYGFTKYVFELIDKEHPSHLAIAFDPPGGTFRHDRYPEYKGNRSATPQLIIDALQPLCEICGALNIPVLMINGYEADDIIGSMAKKAEKEGFTVYMVTPDKDYGQLVSEHILQYRPGKAGGEKVIVGPKEICEKYGLRNPAQVIEVLTLCGDASDNVPGVKGVGEVGAKKLLASYGSVKNIYDHLDELGDRQREMFEQARDHIELSHWLVTIKTDIDLSSYHTEDMAVDGRYSPKIRELFDFYEFDSLKRYIASAPVGAESPEAAKDKGRGNASSAGTAGSPAVVTGSESAETKAEIEFIESDFQALAKAAENGGLCSVDIDGNGGIAVAAKGADGTLLAGCGQPADFRAILENGGVSKAGCGLKELYKSLLIKGISLNGKYLDVEIMDYVLNPEKSHKPEYLAKTLLGTEFGEVKATARQQSLFGDEEDGAGEESTGEKTALMHRAATLVLLAESLNGSLKDSGTENVYYDIEEPLIRVLAKMENAGVKVDVGQLKHFSDRLSAEMNECRDRIREMVDEPELNVMSPKQIGVLLFEKLQLDPKMKSKADRRNGYPTDEETLNSLAGRHPVVNEILEYRGLRKLLSTYIDPLPSYISPLTGRIHTNFNQAQTATGRLSSSKPNLQNIPVRTERGKEIRRAFISGHPGGVILSADYSQIELRIMAHLSCDRHLLEAFRNGEDVHRSTAAKIFGIPPEEVTPEQRRIAKTANFGIMYGISAFGLAQRLHIGRGDAKQIIDDYFSSFPSIRAYIDDTLASVRENGYAETLFGRRRYIADINSRNGTVRALAERNAVNAPIQGTAADIIKIAMINIDRRLEAEGLRSRMVLQIHDELLFDAYADEIDALKACVVEEMENVTELSVPLTVECNYGKNWLEAH